MSVCGQSGQAEEDSASEEVGTPATRDIYKQKPASKVVRVLTVLAYLLSVSLAAILLSVYYICVWRSPELQLEALNDTGGGGVSAYRDNRSHYENHAYHTSHIGGGDTTVNGDMLTSPPENITSGLVDDEASESTTDANVNVTGVNDVTPSPGLQNTTDFVTIANADSIT